MSTQQPDALEPNTALRVAQNCRETGSDPSCPFFARVQLTDAAYVLERQHAENESLQRGYDAARLEIASLQAQLEAIGAGGVEPLRSRQCLHQIAEPAHADSTPELHVGNSAFEGWYSGYNPARKSDKQRARDAYAAGMGDPQAAPAAVAGPSQETCQTCQGNGEVVTDWERYKHPLPGDVGDEAVAECQDCDGQGTVDAAPTAQAAPAAVAGPSLYQVMAVAKAIHATTPDADDWDSLRQWEVDALRRRAEKVLAPHAAAPTTQAAPQREAQEPVAHDEDLLERLYWDFDSQRKKTGEERLAFKGKMRSYASEFRRRSVGQMVFAQSVSDDMMNLADRLGDLPYVDPRAWRHLLVYAPQPVPAPLSDDAKDAARLERERICAVIKVEDDYCVDHGNYMLDSDDCIKIVRGEWVRPDFAIDAARKQGTSHDNT